MNKKKEGDKYKIQTEELFWLDYPAIWRTWVVKEKPSINLTTTCRENNGFIFSAMKLCETAGNIQNHVLYSVENCETVAALKQQACREWSCHEWPQRNHEPNQPPKTRANMCFAQIDLGSSNCFISFLLCNTYSRVPIFFSPLRVPHSVSSCYAGTASYCFTGLVEGLKSWCCIQVQLN